MSIIFPLFGMGSQAMIPNNYTLLGNTLMLRDGETLVESTILNDIFGFAVDSRENIVVSMIDNGGNAVIRKYTAKASNLLWEYNNGQNKKLLYGSVTRSTSDRPGTALAYLPFGERLYSSYSKLPSHSRPRKIAFDKSNNIFLSFGIAHETSGQDFIDTTDKALVKLSQTGTELWSKTPTDLTNDFNETTNGTIHGGGGVTVDNLGNVYYRDAGRRTGTNNSTELLRQLKVLKYDKNGNFIWKLNVSGDLNSTNWYRFSSMIAGTEHLLVFKTAVPRDNNNNNNRLSSVVAYNLSDGSQAWSKDMIVSTDQNRTYNMLDYQTAIPLKKGGFLILGTMVDQFTTTHTTYRNHSIFTYFAVDKTGTVVAGEAPTTGLRVEGLPLAHALMGSSKLTNPVDYI